MIYILFIFTITGIPGAPRVHSQEFANSTMCEQALKALSETVRAGSMVCLPKGK